MLAPATSNVLAQANNGWTTHTSEKCNVSFEYPSNWILKIKRGAFDINMTSEIELYNPELDLTGLFPSFSVGGCMDLEMTKQIIRTMKINPYVGQFLGNSTIDDAKSLSMLTESFLTLAFTALGMAEDLGSNASANFEFDVVEHTSISPKFIANEDAGIYSYIASNSSTGNDSSKKVAGQVYSVVHNGTAYAFYHNDDLAKFDLPENTQTRERILKSIHFLN